MIQYPKAQLKELFSIKITSDFFNKLIDNENYVNRLERKLELKMKKYIFKLKQKENLKKFLKV